MLRLIIEHVQIYLQVNVENVFQVVLHIKTFYELNQQEIEKNREHGRTARSYVLEYLDLEILAKQQNVAKFCSRFTQVAIFTAKAFLHEL